MGKVNNDDIAEHAAGKHQEDLQRLKKFRLMDDEFMTKCFEGDTASVELVLRILLEEPGLKVEEVRTQVFVENLLNRSVQMDIVVTDRVRFFKESKEGVAIMSRVMEEMLYECRKESRKEIALRMLRKGELSVDVIAEYSGLDVEEVERLAGVQKV